MSEDPFQVVRKPYFFLMSIIGTPVSASGRKIGVMGAYPPAGKSEGGSSDALPPHIGGQEAVLFPFPVGPYIRIMLRLL